MSKTTNPTLKVLHGFLSSLQTQWVMPDYLEILRKQVSSNFKGYAFLLSVFNRDIGCFNSNLIAAPDDFFEPMGFESATETEYAMGDVFLKTIFSNPHPTTITVEQMAAATKKKTSQVEKLKSCGIREVLFMPVSSGNEKLGMIILDSKQYGGFDKKTTQFVQNLAGIISTSLSNLIAWETIERKNKERDVLYEISQAISKVRDKRDLLKVTNSQLRKLFHFNDMALSVIDPDTGMQRFTLVDVPDSREAMTEHQRIISQSYPFPDGVFELCLERSFPVLFKTWELVDKEDVPEYVKWGYHVGSREFVTVPLRDSGQDIGVLYLTSDSEGSFKISDLHLLQLIAPQLSTAVANILMNEEMEKRELQKSLLLSFSNEMATVKDRSGICQVIKKYFAESFAINNYIIQVKSVEEENYITFLQDFLPEILTADSVKNELNIPSSLYQRLSHSDLPVTYMLKEVIKNGSFRLNGVDYEKLTAGCKTLTGLMLRVAGENIGAFWTCSNEIDADFLKGIISQIAIAISNAMASEKLEKQLEQINRYKNKLEAENFYLQEQINTTNIQSEMVGTGPEMQNIYQLINDVAYSNSSVLILGETGTGKEMVAKAIHHGSARRNKLMVKVNCASLPANLIESELFGHEKGSFTGATGQRIGKFELADKSTLFLDEIGELSLDLQAKLLRVLQEKEIERLGSNTPVKINVRIVAATNRDLIREVKEGRFRSDLYYRLNVFPISLPPLRERPDDILALTVHFVNHFSKLNGKTIANVSQKAMTELLNYDWPGNVRELEHLIERCVLLTRGNTIKDVNIPITAENNPRKSEPEDISRTLVENEKQYIIAALKKCEGKVFGHGGAAELLDIHVSTLNSKIRKFGIKKDQVIS